MSEATNGREGNLAGALADGSGTLVRLSVGPHDGRVVRIEQDRFQTAMLAAKAAACGDGDSAQAGDRVVWRDFDDVWVLSVTGDAAVYVQQRPPHESSPSR